MIENTNNLSDYDAEQLIYEVVKRLKETSYARGYKDGFNDGKNAEWERQLFLKRSEKRDE